MNYCNIKSRDIANGVGVRVTLFVSGCRNHCKNCFQPETWAFDYGEAFTKEVEDHLLEQLRPAFVHGLTLLGGEPGEAENQRGLVPFLRRVRQELPDKSIWCYSGYTLDRELFGPSSWLEGFGKGIPAAMNGRHGSGKENRRNKNGTKSRAGRCKDAGSSGSAPVGQAFAG